MDSFERTRMRATPPSLDFFLQSEKNKVYGISSTGNWNGHGFECSRPMRPTAQLFTPNCRPKGDIHCPPCVIHVQRFTHVRNGSLGTPSTYVCNEAVSMYFQPFPTVRVGRSAKISLWHPLTARCCPQVSPRSSRAIPAWAMPIALRHPLMDWDDPGLETMKQIPDASSFSPCFFLQLVCCQGVWIIFESAEKNIGTWIGWEIEQP